MREPTLSDLDHLHAHKEPGSGLTVWWIDDCFTNEQAATSGGGHLQLENVASGDIDPYAGNSNEQTCADLLQVVEQEGVNLKMCSFEYASEHWENIDASKNAVLIDIGYEGQPNEDFDDNFFGVEFYYAKAKSREPAALCSFLSDSPTRVVDWAKEQKGWFPSIPYPMTKASRDLRKQIGTMVQYLKDSQPRGASEWDAETWQELRSEAWEACQEFGSNESPLEAHHLPGGGDGIKNEELTTRLYERLSPIGGGAVRQLPSHYWRKEKEDLSVWDQPPIRAIAQFDKGSRDLSFVLELGEQQVKNRLDNIDLGVTFRPPTLKHDYLWFNASALVRGLYRLAEGFSGEFNRPDRDIDADSGRISWHIAEESDGLHITVSQVKLKKGEHRKNAPQISRRLHKLPDESNASGTVKEAYGFFKNAGAEIEERDGSLIVRVPSNPHPDLPFSVWRLQEIA